MSRAVYHIGHTLDVVRSLPDASVDLVLTSPPFLALRSYLPADDPAKVHEIGQEANPAAFVDTLLELSAEWRRVLAPHGSIAIELGDTYSGSGGSGGDYADDGLRGDAPKFKGSARAAKEGGWPLAKSLALVPELYRIGLAYGLNPLTGQASPAGRWRVRNVVRWHRPNPPVGALGDKFRPSTSEMVVACTSARRWFDLDAVRTEHVTPDAVTRPRANYRRSADDPGVSTNTGGNPAGAPPLDTWIIPTEPYSGAHYACVDDQTEALTPHGWRRHDQLTDGDTIAAYDADRGVIVWQSATFHRYPFDGELVAFNQRETVQRLTPNHRVLHQTGRGTIATRRADEARPSWRLPLAAPFDVPGAAGPGDALAALLGWYVTEGHASSRNVARIYQSETANPKNCARIRDLLDAAHADYSERRRVRPAGASLSPRESVEVTWAVRGDVARWLLDTAPGKQLPAVVLGWTDTECGALLDALIDGDGHTRTSGRRQFIQKDEHTIDMVQALCSRLGLRSTISPRKSGGWSLTIGERKWATLRGTNGASIPIGRERYAGIVWCPAVESTYWLARRSGRPFITGNTWPRALCVKPIESMCPRKVCTVCGEPSRRIVEPTVEYAKVLGDSIRSGNDNGAAASAKRNKIQRQGITAAQHETLGWSDCGCSTDGSHWRNGVVLDPFGGSGTTAAVATGLGRDAILIDLDERNAALAEERVGMFLTVKRGQEL